MYDYAPGKTDWLASGLPREGTSQKEPYAGDLAHAWLTCGPNEKLAEVRERAVADSKDMCVVIDHDDHVLGVLKGDALSKDGEITVVEAMDSSPQTFRASQPLNSFIDDPNNKDIKVVIVTTPHGRLLGAVTRAELEQAVEQQREEAP
ncbi:MAG: hypothetical protein M3214_13830 [Actinomycetota bacterium]|nr:hypothetical protein [Actinomycetota bacterium]